MGHGWCKKCRRWLPIRTECVLCRKTTTCCDLKECQANVNAAERPYPTTYVCQNCYVKTIKSRYWVFEMDLRCMFKKQKLLTKTVTVEKSFLQIIKDMDNCYKIGNTNRQNFWKHFYELFPE